MITQVSEMTEYDVIVVSTLEEYNAVLDIIKRQGGETALLSGFYLINKYSTPQASFFMLKKSRRITDGDFLPSSGKCITLASEFIEANKSVA